MICLAVPTVVPRWARGARAPWKSPQGMITRPLFLPGPGRPPHPIPPREARCRLLWPTPDISPRTAFHHLCQAFVGLGLLQMASRWQTDPARSEVKDPLGTSSLPERPGRSSTVCPPWRRVQEDRQHFPHIKTTTPTHLHSWSSPLPPALTSLPTS